MVQHGITARLSADSIYSGSLVQAEFTAPGNFAVSVDGHVTTVCHGSIKDTHIDAVHRDGRWVVSVDLLNWINERPLSDGDPPTSYGMRFFPFISAKMVGRIRTTHLPLEALIIELPDAFRLIWYGVVARDPAGNAAKLHHSHGAVTSKFILLWPPGDAEAGGEYLFEIPVRLGGTTFLKLSHFQIYYWILALIVVALASFAPVTVLLAAIAGAWTFMLQALIQANVPQRATLLAYVYEWSGVSLLAWGLAWVAFGPGALLLALPVLAVAWLAHRTISFFQYTGTLPVRIAHFWQKRVRRADENQRLAHASAQAGGADPKRISGDR